MAIIGRHRVPQRNWNFVRPRDSRFTTWVYQHVFKESLSKASKHPINYQFSYHENGTRHKKSILASQQWLWFHIWFIMILCCKIRQILLQNTTAILLQNMTKVYFKMRQIFYYKMWQFITKCVDFITECDSYYKMRSLLQNVSVHLWIKIRKFNNLGTTILKNSQYFSQLDFIVRGSQIKVF